MPKYFNVFLIMFFLASPVLAAETPSQIVQNLYKPYLDDPHADLQTEPSATDAIRPYASHALGNAIDMENACVNRTGEMCALDSDILIAGQDWDITDFRMESENGKNSAIVRVYFKNGLPVRTNFMFVKENQDWKIDEIESLLYDEDEKLASVWLLKRGLNEWHAEYNKPNK
ncbi:MAG: DUF3828 domain-containing protein [Alphaproteobacteria bacterium]|nr:MAG: DUF3828 domain-containing protein [Alphaproteobacteria bacterium]